MEITFIQTDSLSVSLCLSSSPALYPFASLISLHNNHILAISALHLTTEPWTAMFTVVLETVPGMQLEFKNIC